MNFDLESLFTSSNAATAAACTSAVGQSAEELRKSVAETMEILSRLDRLAPRMPDTIYQSPLAVQHKPVRVHKKRRNQTEAYHRRIQKKWDKRFGKVAMPAAFRIDRSFLGGSGYGLVVHPSIYESLRRL